MYIKPFAVEEWMNEYEVGARFNIAETCVDSVSLDELFALTGEDKARFLADFSTRRLTYGDIVGSDDLRGGICRPIRPCIRRRSSRPTARRARTTTCSARSISAGDRVVSIMPTYQQLYSIPASIGADVAVMHLKQENDYLPDLDELRALVTPETKMICINNPNNPTGALMSREQMEEIVEIARGVGAYILCDEVYRHLTQEDSWSESIADLYEKGISVSSMSKVFSLAGLRMGWIATHDEAALCAFLSHRDYNLISCGMFDDAVASIALRHSDAMLRRNQTIVRENLAILDAWVAAHEHFYYTKPKAGTTALVYYDFDVPSYDFCKRMYRETGAFVTPGDCFEQPHSMRIGYACDKQTLTEGLAALAAFGEMLG